MALSKSFGIIRGWPLVSGILVPRPVDSNSSPSLPSLPINVLIGFDGQVLTGFDGQILTGANA